MKLIKFIAASALVASTSLVSGGHPTSSGLTQDVARACPNWPFCRDIEISEQSVDIHQAKAEVERKTA